jgi:error-prone DNA polymerase
VVGDARRHGVVVLGPDLCQSGWSCTLAAQPDGRPAVRLGLRYVRGLGATSGAALIAERERRGSFRDLADLARRTHRNLTSEAVLALIASGAADGWGVARRQLLWQLPSVWAAVAGLDLPTAPVALPLATAADVLAGEVWATGIPLSGHPVALLRPALARRGAVPLAALGQCQHGTCVLVAGQLVLSQRPPTAHGVAFATLEDETGLGNVLLAPAVDARYRAVLHTAPLVLVTGQVQRRGQTAQLRVQRVQSWPG